MWIVSSLSSVLTPTAVALGNFDGVHRGHQKVIRPIIPVAPALQDEQEELLELEQPARSPSSPVLQKQNRLPSRRPSTLNQPELSAEQDSSGGRVIRPVATVVTFQPHPREFFTGEPQALLTPPEEKAHHLRTLGVEQLVLLPFNRDLANLSPQQFVNRILVQYLQAKQVSVGQDFCFGYQRSGTATDLKAIAASYGIAVTITPLETSEGERISSSSIRQALQDGNLPVANRLLGHPYMLMGQVVRGQQLGQTLGFPTANLKVSPKKFLPCSGVYCVRVSLSEQEQTWPGVMNLGCRPTVNGHGTAIEVHLLDWSGDLYGQTLVISLEQFLRPEYRFPSLEALKAQIQADCDAARKILAVAS